MQNSIKKNGHRGKVLAMKENWNLVVKNKYFREISHATLLYDIKDKSSHLFMRTVMKRNG